MECWAHQYHSRNSQTPSYHEREIYLPFYFRDRISSQSMLSAAKRMFQRAFSQGLAPHVCVVGAGFAGLRCADILSSRGVKVTIIEARNRVGGRVHQSDHLGTTVDLGPNWIHGTNHNPILGLAKQTLGTTFTPPDDATPFVYDENGHRIDAETAAQYSELVWGMIGEGFKYSNQNTASIPPEISLMDFLKSLVKEKGLDHTSSKTVLQMARMWGDFVGEPIEKQSMKYFWLEECIEGENLFLATTYKAILELISKEAMKKSTFYLSTKVTAIASKSTSDAIHSVTISTADATIHEFDDVIVTCPLGWLKRNPSIFSPPLPPQITNAIHNIGYGRLEKVYVAFPTAFWHTETSQPFFTQYLSPTYTDQNPEQWTIEAVSLATLPDNCAQPTLLFYINGPCSQHVTSLVRGLEPSSKEHFSKLNAFFAPYYSRLPNYDPSSESSKPRAILATDWQNDEFSGWGSYTTFQVSKAEDEVHLDKDIEALREGCPERGIWFAGEHTAPFVALGTVTGAYWSGERVAGRILEAYGR